MTTLFTAFKGKNNTSCRLLSRINGCKLFLTNPFFGLERDISGMVEAYDAVIMFGADKSLLDCVRIECVAALGPDRLETAYPVEALARRCQEQKISCHISWKPGNYLCNAAYYHMLKRNACTVFIHIPSIGTITEHFLNRLAEAVEQQVTIYQEVP